MNNLKQLATAVLNYETESRHYPASTRLHTDQHRPSISWRVMILPQLEENALYELTGPLPDGGAVSAAARFATVEVYLCPSTQRPPDGSDVAKTSNYSGVAGAGRSGKRIVLEPEPECGDIHTDGIFIPETKKLNLSPTRLQEVTDGTSKTLAIGERTYIPPDWTWGATWKAGTGKPYERICTGAANNVVYPLNAAGFWVGDGNAPPGAPLTMKTNDLPFGSFHTGGVQFCFADGSVHMLSDKMDVTIFQDLATIDGGEVNRWSE
jgi:prepilin-type processing-associated H-X9-DG protein